MSLPFEVLADAKAVSDGVLDLDMALEIGPLEIAVLGIGAAGNRPNAVDRNLCSGAGE